jgi:hypothetical protein
MACSLSCGRNVDADGFQGKRHKTRIPMSKDKKSNAPRDTDDQVFGNFLLLALPWLSLQRDLLAIGRRGIQDYSHVRPVQNFTLREIQALMMVLDPSRTWRDSYGEMESRLEETSTQSISKLMSGLSSVLESQEEFINSVIETLNASRTSKKSRATE